MSYTTDDRARTGPARVRDVRPVDHRGHPPRGRDRHLRHPRLGRQAAACRTSTTCCSWARRCRAIRSRATANAATPTSCSAIATPNTPLHLDIPDHHRGHVVRRAVRPGQGGARPRRQRGRHVDHDRRRRHDARGARPEQVPGLPIPSVALRDEPRRPSQGRRDRGGPRARAPSPAAAECCSVRRSRRASPGCAPCPRASTSARRAGIPDWTGPDDLTIKINELREITDWEKPIYVKVGATRTYYDVKLAVHAGADVVVVDGMQGGTAATQEVFIEHVGIPTLAAVPEAVQALEELGVHRQGAVDRLRRHPHRRRRRQGAGARRRRRRDRHRRTDRAWRQPSPLRGGVRRLGSAAGFFDDFQDGSDPAGISTQDPELAARFDPVEGGRRLANYLRVLTMEAQTIARACGKAHVLHLEPEDLVAVTIEAAAMARVPLAGTDWIPGR